MKRIMIPASSAYEVWMEGGALARTGSILREVCPRAERVFLLTDDHVAPLYAEKTAASLRDAGIQVFLYVMPHGEKHKTIGTWQDVLENMCGLRLTRGDALAALGGGVVGDLGGFAAATYQRGIDYVQIPTTLLAMVDSSVGGKTAVDLKSGKNQVGAFYQPRAVICDPETLGTLPEEEYRCGCAEVIKYGMIGDADFFRSLGGKPVRDQLEKVIATCVEMKRDYVLQDEYDRGLRMMLNFGHTFGHACEACSGFSILHGQGVAMGMAVMARSACARGLLAAEDRDALIRLIRQYGLPTEASWPAEAMTEACLADKKATGKNIRIVVPTGIGRCEIVSIPTGEIGTWLRQGGVQ
ncbi:MAG: 3-dehydroquinate synthase [Clostridia bacterium]|nr:3-dehydroquinate synthase [Clostridia bacterium]